ncbi:MAG: SDR family oxidoreductase [Synergistaceae bacterium]|jgi:NAD(P)-dependent dehydrogenase (short-subunit alcohol dehydrogenase family)|nr:SDR family oxidoreductase [Synergistaceae bacterium]
MGILEKFKLDGKKAFVTGAARGIGKSIATALLEAGAEVAIVDIDIDEAKKTAEALKAIGPKVFAVGADLTKPADVERMTGEVVDGLGELNIAFCNAGICVNEKAEDMTFEQWRKVMDINLDGVFLSAQAAGRQMIKQGKGGSIINTASMSAHIVNYPQPQCSYNASKAGVIQLSKSLAVEWVDKNIRVNTISPGYIGTELIMNAPHLKALIEEWKKMIPMRRLGQPDELQAISVYLASDASLYTTGSDFVIDGAFTCV